MAQAVALLAFLFSFTLTAFAAESITWDYYGSDAASTKFSKANLITPENVKNLKVIWDWTSIDQPIQQAMGLKLFSNEATPLMIDGRLYLNTQLSQVAALDAVTGQTIWTFDPPFTNWVIRRDWVTTSAASLTE